MIILIPLVLGLVSDTCFAGRQDPQTSEPASECASQAASIESPLGRSCRTTLEQTLSALSSVGSASVSELTVPLRKLIAVSLDHDGATSIQSLSEVAAMAGKSPMPERQKRVDHLITLLSGYQFDPKQVARELVANAQDAYSYDRSHDPRSATVTVDSREGVMSISDHGLGMSLNDVILYLLTPGRSKNPAILKPDEAAQGVTGKFGQGFFSVLSYLKAPGDLVQINTQSEGESPIHVSLFREPTSGEIMVRLQSGSSTGDPAKKGTSIKIHSKTLVGDQRHAAETAIRDGFHLGQKGRVLLRTEGRHYFELINPPQSSRVLEFSRFQSSAFRPVIEGSVRILAPETPLQEGQGTLWVTINGVTIQKFQTRGINIYPNVELILPPDTELTPDRGTLNLESPELKGLLVAAFERVAAENNCALLNSLHPILGAQAKQLVPLMNLRLASQTLPAVKEAIEVASISGKGPVQVLHPELFRRVQQNKPLAGPLGVQHRAIVVHGTFRSSDTHFVAVDGTEEDRPILVVDQAIPLESPQVQTVLNRIETFRHSTRLALMRKTSRPQRPWFSLESDQEEFSAVDPTVDKMGDIRGDERTSDLTEDFRFEDWLGECVYSENPITRVLQRFKTEETLSRSVSHEVKEQLVALHMVSIELAKRAKPPVSLGAAIAWVKILAKSISQEMNSNWPCGSSFLAAGQSRSFELLPVDFKEKITNWIERYGEGPHWVKKLESMSPLGAKPAGRIERVSFERQIVQLVTANVDPLQFRKQISNLSSIAEIVGDVGTVHASEPRFDHYLVALKNSLPEGQSTWLKIKEPHELSELFKTAGFLGAFFKGRSLADENLSRRPSQDDWSFLIQATDGFLRRGESVPLFWILFLMDLPVESRNDFLPQIRELLNFIRLADKFQWQGKKAFEFPARKAYVNFARSLFDKLVNHGETREVFDGMRDFCRRAEFEEGRQWFDSPTDLFRAWTDRQILNSITAPALFPILFSDLVQSSSVHAGYFGDLFPRSADGSTRLRPIETHPTVAAILGGSPQDRLKEYHLAIHQHPSQTAWIKELVKNSNEAGAHQIALSFSADSSGNLIMDFTDDGSGVPPKAMHAFFVPKFSTKEKRSGDVNFGWGFFTLFKFFDEIAIESSIDGYRRSFLHLKLLDGKLNIEEAGPEAGLLSGLPSGRKGTRITGRVNHAVDPLLLGSIVGHLSDFTGGLRHIRVQLNGKPFELRGEGPFPEKHLLSRISFEETPSEGPKSQGQIQVYRSAQPGVFYGNQLFSRDFSKFLPASLPESVKSALSGELAIRLDAYLQQNAGRTEFIQKRQWQAQLNHVVIQAAQKLFEKWLSEDPRRFPLPSDYFWDFRQHRIQPDLRPDWLAHITDEKQLESAIIALLHPLREKVRAELFAKGLIDASGKYVSSPPVSHLDLKATLGSEYSHLAEQFQKSIESSMESVRTQGGAIAASLAPDHGPTPSEVKDLSGAEVASNVGIQLEGKDQLPLFEKWVKDLVRHFFKREIEARFYWDADGSAAHAYPGSHAIAFNLSSPSVKNFLTFQQTGKLDTQKQTTILDDITHELTHTEEVLGEKTHDQNFYEKQTQKLALILRDLDFVRTKLSESRPARGSGA